MESIGIVARNSSGNIVAVYPLFLVPTLGGVGKVMVSVPRADLGGPLIGDTRTDTQSVYQSLVAEVKRRAISHRGVLILNRGVTNADLIRCTGSEGVVDSPTKGVFRLDLRQSPPSQIWSGVFTKKGNQRKIIRQLERLGCFSRLARDSTDFEEFLKLYVRTITRAGGTPEPDKFIRRVWSYLNRSNFNILLVENDAKLAAAIGFFSYDEQKQIHTSYAAYSTEPGTPRGAYLYANWSIILWAHQNGFTKINLGSTNADPRHPRHRFKRQFGGVFTPTYQITHPTSLTPLYNLLKSGYRTLGRGSRFAKLD